MLLYVPSLVIGQQKIIWKKDQAEMVLIPVGSFEMGDHFSEGSEDELPVHKVEMDSFYMDIHEVTVGQFKKFVNETGYDYNTWNDVAKFSPGHEYPMIYVNWNDAMSYAKWANKRLPTEAEWEYAARGGLKDKRYPWEDHITHDNANYSGTGGRDKWEYCSPVGSFEPNGYGLYDMAGNVYESCADWYNKNHYRNSSTKNPLGPAAGQYRVLRGGCWGNSSNPLRASSRYSFTPTNRSRGYGFRCVSSGKFFSDTFISAENKPRTKLTIDINSDGIINIFDLVITAGSFGKTGDDIKGDINRDGTVNIFDLVIVATSFGKSLVAAPFIVFKTELSTKQKQCISLAIHQLGTTSNRSDAEEIVLGVLKSIFLERLPIQTQLLANYPNPFNPETWIPFKLAQDSTVTAQIYDVGGQRIRIIELGHLSAGNYVKSNRAIYWDGRTEDGEKVSSGTYFYQIKAGDYTETKKLVVLK